MDDKMEHDTETKTEETADEPELDDRFKDDPEAKYRLYSMLSFFVVLVIIGIPVWWYTTRVYRASLPLYSMADVDLPSKTIRENSIPFSLEYDVLVTIINPDPHLKVDLNVVDINNSLKPFLKLVEPIANFTIKSQWLYLVDLGVTLDSKGNHLGLYEEQLPHIITPLEKKIWSHMSLCPSLNLVLYVSHCNRPIILYDKYKMKVDTNAFLSPCWGGITILNANKTECDKRLYTPSVQPIVNIFLAQLRELLGLKDITPDDITNLKIMKAREMIDSTRRTLKSLAQLLSEISSIVISDEVAYKIRVALDNADQADTFIHDGQFDKALKVAKISYKNSEEAFSDPSLLALLYFPDDQKYAIYIPLFLPIMIPVFISLTTIRKWYSKSADVKTKID